MALSDEYFSIIENYLFKQYFPEILSMVKIELKLVEKKDIEKARKDRSSKYIFQTIRDYHEKFQRRSSLTIYEIKRNLFFIIISNTRISFDLIYHDILIKGCVFTFD